MFGYHGKILRVNLSESRITEEELPEDMVRKYLGGGGVATRYLYDEVVAGADPLGAENRLIFMTGPLTGTASPSAARYSVVAKSPLTGIWAQANSGGDWGPALKRTGYDGIIFEGVALKPVYLVIEEDRAELKDAAGLWGQSVSETYRSIHAELGDRFNVTCIGIAGENQVKYAAIMNNQHHAVGRCGMGAVMGSKNLKAIAVNGRKPVTLADPFAFAKSARKQYDMLNQAIIKIGFETFGTNMMMDQVHARGGLPVKNWQSSNCSHIDEIGAIALYEKLLEERTGCFGCNLHCNRRTRIKSGPYQGIKGEGPHYETIAVFGGMCFNDNLEAIANMSYLCSDYGLDTISTGNTIGFAMECYEKGILTRTDTEGMELKFGDPAATIELVHRIARREGIGDLLAEGVMRASQKLGGGSEDFAMHVKGLELPGYDPRAVQLAGLAYATANRGGDHMTGYVHGPALCDYSLLVVDESQPKDRLVADPEEVRIVKDLEDTLVVFDCLGICKFVGFDLPASELVNSVVYGLGWDFSLDELKMSGERVYNLARAFSIREGLTAAGDTLPRRLLEQPLPDGPARGHVVQLAPLLDAYYELRKWDKDSGRPKPAKLEQLGLMDIIPDIWGHQLGDLMTEAISNRGR